MTDPAAFPRRALLVLAVLTVVPLGCARSPLSAPTRLDRAVRDGGGTVRAQGGPNRLVADFSYVCENYVCRLTDTSQGPAPIVSWVWQFGDGTVSTGPETVHAYPLFVRENDPVTLTVMDTAGATDSVTHRVHIRAKFGN
jgi:PKD repeat protein